MAAKWKADAKCGDRIRARRLELGLSQRALQFNGVSYAYISRIESGDRQPSLSALVGLAEQLDTTALWLATGRTTGWCPLCDRGEKHKKAP